MQENASGELQDCRISAKSFAGCEKARPSYGIMQDELKVCYELPPVGSIVEVYDVCWLERNKYEEDGKKPYRTFLQPHPNCVSENKVIKRFRVRAYTHGIERPLYYPNKMVLECVYPEECKGIGLVTVPTRWISTGSTVAKIVDASKS